MEIGDIYKLRFNSGREYINLYEGEEDKVKTYISIGAARFYSNSSCLCNGGEIVDITDEEKLWLLKCIEINKYIPFNEVKSNLFKFGK